MVFKNRKKGQAAIEFLMTYGWMLLVVLIVGALIFSFVDFGSLLPNQLTMSNGVSVDSNQMKASATKNQVSFAFTYIGSQSVVFNATLPKLISDSGFSCNKTQNLGTNNLTIVNVDTGNTADSSGSNPVVQFINGQVGIISFPCATPGLVRGDILQGKVTIPFNTVRTKFETISSGRIRLTISD